MIVVASISILVQRDRISSGYDIMKFKNLYRQIEYLVLHSVCREAFGRSRFHYNLQLFDNISLFFLLLS